MPKNSSAKYYQESLFSFVRKLFFQEIRVNLFILYLGLKSPQGRLNPQKSLVMRNLFTVRLIISHPRA